MAKKKQDKEIENQVEEIFAQIEANVMRISLGEIVPPIFLDYAMDVITDRALSDSRDGLKPVHRRILYAMSELLLWPEKTYRKSARVVGDVLGKMN